MTKGMAGLLIVVTFALAGMPGCDRENKQEGSRKNEKIVVAVTPWPASAALYVAQEKGYFKDEGIDVALQPYISGHLGLAAVVSGKADLATAGETPVARAAIEAKPIAVIATLCEINKAVLIVARKDRGISSPDDLKGKKVGVVPGTTADFFLHIFLTTNYIKPAEVQIIKLETDQVIDALVRGDVDAVSTWSPHTIVAREKLGDKAVIFDDPSIYKMTWNLTSTKDFAESHQDGIQKVLRAIIRANAFIGERPGETRAVTSRNIGTDSPLFDREWEDYMFTAALDKSLLLNLEDQARWMNRRESSSLRKPPNFMNFIHTKGLKAVQPTAVDIIGR